MALHDRIIIPSKEVLIGIPLNATSINWDRPDLPGLDFEISPVTELINNAMKEISRKREIQIMEEFNKKGFSFDTMEAIEQFAKQRCTIVIHEEKPKIKELWVDWESENRILICIWDETINTSLKYN